LTDIEQASLIRIESLKRIITRERMKNVGLDIQKFHYIPDTLRSDHQGNKFFLYDSGYDDQNRFVIRSSEYKKKFIQKADVSIIDGTFRANPSNFFRMLIVHIYIFGKTYPAFYVLLANKKE
jgi:hypothetical protein